MKQEFKIERERYSSKPLYNVEILTLLKRLEVSFDEFIKRLKEFKSKNPETDDYDYLIIPINKFNQIFGDKLR